MNYCGFGSGRIEPLKETTSIHVGSFNFFPLSGFEKDCPRVLFTRACVGGNSTDTVAFRSL
jgi:hypothetical protein